jgi:hypothetical protein
MDKTQAEAIVQALLEPDPRVQEEIRCKRAAEASLLARQRRMALWMLVGGGIGAAIAHYSGYRFTLGIIWGGLFFSSTGWLIRKLGPE